MASFPLVSATGMLGSGYREDSLDKAVALGARVIGSSGTGGGDQGLAFMRDIVREIARERGLRFKLAAIHSELSRDTVREHLRAGKARPLPPSAPLSEADIDASLHVV